MVTCSVKSLNSVTNVAVLIYKTFKNMVLCYVSNVELSNKQLFKKHVIHTKTMNNWIMITNVLIKYYYLRYNIINSQYSQSINNGQIYHTTNNQFTNNLIKFKKYVKNMIFQWTLKIILKYYSNRYLILYVY